LDTSQKIKVVHLINGLDVGGAETMLLKLISAMDRKQFSNVVVSLTDGGSLLAQLKTSDVPAHSLGMRRGRPTVSGFFRLLRVLREVQPQVVQTWLYHADLLGLLASRLIGIPRCVWNIRVSNLDMDKYPRISRWVLASCVQLSRWPDLVLVNSSTARDFHARLGYRPQAWQVIPNGFDTDKFRPDLAARRAFRKSLGRPDDFMIGLVARYDPMKDHATFLNAVQLFRSAHPESHFVLAGTGIDEANTVLMEMAERLGIRDALTLIGERHDMNKVLPALDALTLSSAFGEGFSNAIGEGMACAIPCVVTDVGDMAKVVGQTGRVVPAEESFSLARIVNAYERTYEELFRSPVRT
jgi:glycosyltransferase involved in cell wall biosynthesis